MAKLDAFFKLMFDTGASDLHIVAGQPPILRVHGELERIKYDPLDDEHLRQMLYEIAPEQKIKTFEETGDVDFGYEIPNVSRFRANFFNAEERHAAPCSARFRARSSPRISKARGLPPVLKKFCDAAQGLVLVTGPTGSGKSTTLAAMVDYANKNRKDHIITVEDPIEFVHESKDCLVNHREVGVHTQSFSAALRGALREDPDIILVGEMRDLETIELALTAASTGHLVFGTLHTHERGQDHRPHHRRVPGRAAGQGSRNGLSESAQGRRGAEPFQARGQEGPLRRAGDAGVHRRRRRT